MTQSCQLLGLLLLVNLCAASRSAEPLRKYPDPGYRKMGVYAGGPRRYFDYSLAKFPLGNTFPNKKKWWSDRKNRPSSESPHTVFTVFCGVRDGKGFESCRRRLDAWLKPEPGIPTYPETIPAICLEEENVASRSRLMDRLARHIRDNYRIPVFQWLSDPYGPITNLTADGWVWDSYGWSPTSFRRHVMGFVLTGKPVICVPWASDPHWPQWTQYPSTQHMMNREWHQFTTCMEFDVSTAPFCVAGPGAMNPWLGSSSRSMRLLRDALRTKRRQMRALRAGDLPLATANFSAAARAVPVGGKPGEPSRYVDDFGNASIIHDATITGFLDLMLTSRPAKPGYLIIRPRPARRKPVQRSVDSTLTYHLQSYFPLKRVRVKLRATAPTTSSARNTLSLSLDELASKSVGTVQQQKQDTFANLVLDVGPKQLNGARDVYLTVRMQQTAGRSDNFAHQLDALVIECEHEPPKLPAVGKLQMGQYGGMTYTDDFSTTRWQYLGNLQTSAKTHGGYRGTSFWVGMKGGYGISTTLRQRFSAPKPLSELEVSVQGYANSRQLGGSLTVGVAKRGDKKLLWTKRSGPVHQGRLTLKVLPKHLQGLALKDFDVQITLGSGSGVEHGSKACATADAIFIKAR